MNASAVKIVEVKSISACLRDAIDRLRRSSDSPRLDAERLLSATMQLSCAQLHTREAQGLSAAQAQAFETAMTRRENGEPIAYILGEHEFWSLRLRVTPAVLVPRPETELLVEWALHCVQEISAPAIADLGTGSGAIALALAQERADARVIAVDSSAAALAVARANADALGLTRVEFRQGDWFAPLRGTGQLANHRFDLLVSNPPYIADGDVHLQALRHEPLSALTSGVDGLDAIRHLVHGAPAHLNAGGWLLLEHGATQAAAVRALLDARGFTGVATRRDLAGLERASGACWPQS